jgi:hypothetical protein
MAKPAISNGWAFGDRNHIIDNANLWMNNTNCNIFKDLLCISSTFEHHEIKVTKFQRFSWVI